MNRYTYYRIYSRKLFFYLQVEINFTKKFYFSGNPLDGYRILSSNIAKPKTEIALIFYFLNLREI